MLAQNTNPLYLVIIMNKQNAQAWEAFTKYMSNWIFDTRLGIVSLSRYSFREHNYRAHNPTKSSLWRKARRAFAFSRQYELKWQPPFYRVDISSANTTQNLRLKKKTKRRHISLFTSPDYLLCSVFTLDLGGLRKRRKQGRKGRRDRCGTGKTASNRKEQNGLG